MTDSRTDFDSPWKDSLETYFRDFITFFFPPIHNDIDWTHGYEFLDTELQQVVRDAELGAPALGLIFCSLILGGWIYTMSLASEGAPLSAR